MICTVSWNVKGYEKYIGNKIFNGLEHKCCKRIRRIWSEGSNQQIKHKKGSKSSCNSYQGCNDSFGIKPYLSDEDNANTVRPGIVALVI